MKPSEVIKFFGSATKAAAAINVTPQTVERWIKTKTIPINSQKAISWDTKGELRPDVKVDK